MSKTYTSKEFNVAFYEVMLDWVNRGEMGESPGAKWEFTHLQQPPCGTFSDGEWITPKPCTPGFIDRLIYRWKPEPKTVMINDTELIAPEMVAPKIGDMYFTEVGDGNVATYKWVGDFYDLSALKARKVFLTKDDAQAMTDAQYEQRLGVKNESSYRL